MGRVTQGGRLFEIFKEPVIVPPVFDNATFATSNAPCAKFVATVILVFCVVSIPRLLFATMKAELA